MVVIELLSKSEYLERVRQRAAPGPNVDQRIAAVQRCLPTDESEENLRDTMDTFGFDPACGRAGLLEIVPLPSAKAALAREDFKVENWHYDRTAGCLLINLRSGRHESLSAALYTAYRAEDTFSRVEMERAAERFIDEGLGWFKSSSSFGRALKGKAVQLTVDEAAVFGTDFMLME
jgi:hypothetical protein